MKEIADIVAAYDTATRLGQITALATVVGVSGSTYRRPGARMLFAADGRLAGLINAACLESDLSERAKRTIAGGNAQLISYDTTSPDDIVFGLGLGCNGTVEILMEPSQSGSLAKKIEIFRSSLGAEEPTSLATVISVDSVSGVQQGDYLAGNANGRTTGSLADPALAAAIRADMNRLTERSYVQKNYPIGNGQVRLFLEVLTPPLPLIIFGAGPDAIPLVDAAKMLGWHVTVVDHRPAYANKAKVGNADILLVAEPEQLPDRLRLSSRHIAVIMTHNFDKDRKLLRFLLESPANYVGLLGPRSKLENLLQNLEQEGFKPGEPQLSRLHAPIGLDIGAERPEEIALSIVSEIKAVLEGRSGGFLRHRIGPIH